jgi:hypothetical protein
MRDLPSRPQGPFFFICIAVVFTGSPIQARAADFNIFEGPGHYSLIASPYMGHFRPSPEHRHVYALGLERRRDDGLLGGAAYFRNSFGQPSAYAYIGRSYAGFFGEPRLTAQWTAGLLYGYKGKYKNKVPLNVNGFSPGAVISAGWRFSKDLSTEFHLLGDAGLMVQLSYRLP